MEALIVLILVCALAVLATRYGFDSREAPRSKEHELAMLGLTWGPPAPAAVPSRTPPALLQRLRPRPQSSHSVSRMQLWSDDAFGLALAAARSAEDQRNADMARLARQAVGRGRSLRSQLAVLLTALADWLDPEGAHVHNQAQSALGLLGGSPNGVPRGRS